MEPLGAVKSTPRSRVPTALPALVALAVVVALSLAMFGWTSHLMRDTTRHSTMLVNIQLRSVELLDDIRYNLIRVEAGTMDRVAARDAIVRDLHEYAPLIREPREIIEFVKLRVRLEHGLDVPFMAPERMLGHERIERSLERLVLINERAARRTLAEIEQTGDTALIGHLIAAIAVLVAASIVASVLYRVLARQRVRIAQDLQALEARNNDLAAFVGRTAHDLRGPLTPIRGYAELLAAGGADSEKAAVRIRSAAERMSTILDELMVLATTGMLRSGEAEVGQVVRDVLADLSAELGDAMTFVSADNCRVGCAPGAMYQMLHNLISNSCKYRSSVRTLELSLECRSRGDIISIAITDNGIGMHPDAVERAFEPYFRAEETSKVGGTGLGLSIVPRMSEALGGSCSLTSELGKGTRVELRLPRARPQPEAEHAA
jgi:signal transduction histidine kinase